VGRDKAEDGSFVISACVHKQVARTCEDVGDSQSREGAAARTSLLVLLLSEVKPNGE